jgi:hypothetical protein
MKGLKGSVYNGGNRVPFYLSYPAKFKGNMDINITSAHIDVLPTIAEICNVDLPPSRNIDGESLVPLLNGQDVNWNDRSLFFYWTRKYPELYSNIALRKGEFKLVGHDNYDAKIEDFELYNIATDPDERNNIILENKEIATQLKKDLDGIYMELIKSENVIDQPPIILGSSHENPSFLNRNDAGGDRGIWAQNEVYGKWHVKILPGTYNFTFKFKDPVESQGKMVLEIGQMVQLLNNETEGDIIKMNEIKLPEFTGDLIPFYNHKGKRIFPFWVEVEKMD